MIFPRIVLILSLLATSSCRFNWDGELSGPTTMGAGIGTSSPVVQVDAANSEIIATDSITADGVSVSDISITLKDKLGGAVTGVVPQFTASGSSNTKGPCTASDASGVSLCTLRSTKAERKTISLSSPVSKTGNQITFNSGVAHASKSTITGAGPILANGTDTGVVTITLKDEHENPVAGQVPTFSATDFDAKNVYGACSTTDANGVSTCTIKSSEWDVKDLTIQTPVVKKDGSIEFTEIDYCTGSALTNTPFAFGDGSAANPYGICTAAQLASIGVNATYVTKSFKLYKNIDLSSYTANSFVLIGSAAVPFTGTFHGNRKIISNLTFNDTTATGDNMGLFRKTSVTALIRHLGLTGFNITGRAIVGALVGDSGGSVEYCYAKGSVRGTTDRVGGLLGRYWAGTGTFVRNSYTEMTVTGVGMLGGLIGWVRGTISDSYAKGVVTGTGDRVGGLIGTGDIASIVNSYAESTVSGRDLVGGLAGMAGASGSSVSNISQSWAKGTISCRSWCGGITSSYGSGSGTGLFNRNYADVTINTTGGNVGGLLGYAYANYNMENSYAKVTINSTAATYLGGLVYYSYGLVKNCYALPVITTSQTSKGGTEGWVGGNLVGVFWDDELDTSLVAANGGTSTADMKKAQTFIDAGWDQSIWNLVDGSYPTLK